MSFRMQTLNEELEYSWSQKDSVRTGRDIIIAVDHGPKSKHAFDWALRHFCCAGDTVHLVHAVSSLKNNIVYEASQTLMEKLTVEALKVSQVKVVTRIVEGDAGKAICKEAEKVKPIAVVTGTRGRSLMQSVIQGSVSEYCFHNCKVSPVIIVPGIVLFSMLLLFMDLYYQSLQIILNFVIELLFYTCICFSCEVQKLKVFLYPVRGPGEKRVYPISQSGEANQISKILR
ncbi:hypothetical protein SSX86_021090 [Deinandra increscens subsp. villosa]|uniref:UspA domain-containing protein n=1 Tax=Deinandra increscens subsp. villosa TaxID=3103831 RepID=A0AAP0CP31_9ASTR